MKLPDAISGLNKEKLLELLIRYGDKAVLAIVLLFSCGLAWGGIDAMRSKSASTARQPRAIEQAAAQADTHINQLKAPPQNVRGKAEPLAARLDLWVSPKLAPATSAPLFDQPLFEELAKRTKPEVFPIEQLHATAGVAVLAVADRPANPAAAAAPAAPTAPGDKPADRERPGAGRRPPKRPEANPADPFGAGGAQPGGGPAEPPGADAERPRGRITPFVVVTGVVPHEKQVQEYRRRFAKTSYKNEKSDSPVWSEYLVERTEVKPGGEENWQRMDLKLLAKKARDEWAGVQSETLPPEIFMPASGGGPQGGQGQSAGASFTSYCLPLPKLVAESWGPETMHPTLLDVVRRAWVKRTGGVPDQPAPSGPGVPEELGSARPDFMTPEGQGGGGAAGGSQGPDTPAGMAGDGRQQADGLPLRLFRFVDTTVQMGRSYRYRVRLSLWNPNFGLEVRYLNDSKLAENERLASAPSEPSAAVRVPTTMGFLARTLSKADMKRFKSGMLEALVIAESAKTGNYSLRSVITEAGGLVNVDSRLNKPGETRARGEDILTNAVVVDVQGRQQDRGEDRAGGRSPLPPEMFEMLVLQPDGSFAVASVAESQEVIERNIATLPVIESPVKGGTPAAPGPNPAPAGQITPVSPF